MKHYTFDNATLYVGIDNVRVDLSSLKSTSRFAAILTEKNSRVEPVIVFGEKTFQNLPESDEESLLDELQTRYPDIKTIRDQEVKAEFDENGHIVNGDEWKRAPRLALFVIPDVPDVDHLYLGTGIVREVIA